MSIDVTDAVSNLSASRGCWRSRSRYVRDVVPGCNGSSERVAGSSLRVKAFMRQTIAADPVGRVVGPNQVRPGPVRAEKDEIPGYRQDDDGTRSL